jgi:hypothetical protein
MATFQYYKRIRPQLPLYKLFKAQAGISKEPLSSFTGGGKPQPQVPLFALF